MPLYEYQCSDCGTRSEVMQRVSDPPLSTCDDCGGDLKKLISAPAFQFKGSGWYVTDYARSGGAGDGAKAAGSDGDGASTSATSDAGTTGDKTPAASKSVGKTKSERITPDP